MTKLWQFFKCKSKKGIATTTPAEKWKEAKALTWHCVLTLVQKIEAFKFGAKSFVLFNIFLCHKMKKWSWY